MMNTFVASSGLHLVPFGATHHLKNSSTLLDLCIVDDAEKVTEYGQRDVAFLSAHDLIYIKYGVRIERSCGRTVTCRDRGRLDEAMLSSDVGEVDWLELMAADSMDDKIDILTTNLMGLLNKYAPLKRRQFKNFPAPWLTDDIRQAMHERNQVRRLWRRRRTNYNYDRYKHLRNNTQRMIRTAKSNYYLQHFGRMEGACEVWNGLRHLGLIKGKDSGARLSHSVEELNAFFAGDGRMCDAEDLRLSFAELLSGRYEDTSFYWKYVPPLDISRAVIRTTSNAIGTDGISAKYLKLIMDSILPILEHLFNCSLSSGFFPTGWKSALICPIPKVKNPTLVKHYRPISILPVLSKALERVVCEQIRCYLEDLKLFDPCQFAYRRNHSTQTCLIRMLDDVRQAADLRMVTVSVFFDFSKAFDRVDYLTLLRKLKTLNFSDNVLCWIFSYLTGRTQRVRDGASGTISSSTPVEAGVPQGSVLGPLLFTLYLSDFGQVLMNCKYNYYADDLQIYLHCKPGELARAIHSVNEDIGSVIHWATANEFIINADKTQSIIFGTARYINTLDLDSILSIVVDATPIQYSSSIKYLGVVITNNLSWEKQVTSTTGKKDLFCIGLNCINTSSLPV